MREAISTFRRLDAHDELVTGLGRLGHIKMDQERWDEAREIYEEAVRVCRDAGDSLGLAHKTRHLGDVHRHQRQDDLARTCYEEALTLYRKHPDPPKLDLANAVCRLANLDEAEGWKDSARSLWAEAKDLYAELSMQEGVDQCLDRQARLTP